MGVVYAHVVHAHTSIEHLLVKKPWPRPSQAMKSPKPWPMAWPMISQSQSHEKPGQSPGFQAKPGRNITTHDIALSSAPEVTSSYVTTWVRVGVNRARALYDTVVSSVFHTLLFVPSSSGRCFPPASLSFHTLPYDSGSFCKRVIV